MKSQPAYVVYNFETGLRLHFVVGSDVKDKLVEYLVGKGFEPAVSTSCPVFDRPLQLSFRMDFGGVANMNWKTISYTVDGIEFSLWPHHYYSLLNGIDRGLEHDNGKGFARVLLAFDKVVTVDPAVLVKLRSTLVEDENRLLQLMDKTLDDHEKTLQDLQSKGVVATNRPPEEEIN